MNLPEFKAWFEGFSENLSGPPTDLQWKRICGKIAEIKDAPPTPYPVYVDRWLRPTMPWYPHYQPYWGTPGWSALSVANGGQLQLSNVGMNIAQQNAGDYRKAMSVNFDSALAFRDLGRAEALEMRASS